MWLFSEGELTEKKAEESWTEISSLPLLTCSPSAPCTPAHLSKKFGTEISVHIRVETDSASLVTVGKQICGAHANDSFITSATGSESC